MAASNRTPKELQTTGAIILVVGGLVAWGLTWLPTLFETRTTEYSALIPLSIGARGLEAGGPVLYGGAPRGEITSIRTEREPETGMPTVIRVNFALDSSLPLAADATISKDLGIAGTNGAIAIFNPGTPGEVFADGEQRVLQVAATGGAESGGAALTMLGRENARLLTRIDESLNRLGSDVPPSLSSVATSIRRLRVILENLQIEIGSGLQDRRARLSELIAAGRKLQTGLSDLHSEMMAARPAVESLQADIDVAMRRFVSDGKVIRRRIGVMQELMTGFEDRVNGDFVPNLRSMQRDLTSALDESRRLLDTADEIMPEIAASIRPSMARMTLAGGQLVLAFDDLLPLAIEAVLVSPDVNSESRRRMLEAVEDAMLAGGDLRDAASRLENFASMNRPLLESNPDLAPLVTEPLKTSITELETMLQRLAEVLRREIRNPGETPAVTEP